MTTLLIVLSGFWISVARFERVAQGEACSVATWLIQHPADSSLRLLPADALDDTIRSQGPKGPLIPPPARTLQGIAGEIVLATTLDSSGSVISTIPLRTRITRWQAGISPDEVRLWTPEFDTVAVKLVRNQQYPSPTSKGNKVNAFLCVTVRYDPFPVDNGFQVMVRTTP